MAFCYCISIPFRTLNATDKKWTHEYTTLNKVYFYFTLLYILGSYAPQVSDTPPGWHKNGSIHCLLTEIVDQDKVGC